jgi:hypothetical protein
MSINQAKQIIEISLSGTAGRVNADHDPQLRARM